MAGKADMVNGIEDSTTNSPDAAAYASLDAAEAAGAEAERGGWMADG